MTSDRLWDLLQEELDSTRIVAPEGTGLHATARDNLAMVNAYLNDSRAFFSSGDLVNALAASYYGEGWLHCGAACGLFSVAAPRCLFTKLPGPLPQDFYEKLREKAARYARLLATARGAIRPGPEAGTCLHGTAERVAVVAAVYLSKGDRFLAREEYGAALACFSYGHGWIDAGVRSGLFAVTGSREIFTI